MLLCVYVIVSIREISISDTNMSSSLKHSKTLGFV